MPAELLDIIEQKGREVAEAVEARPSDAAITSYSAVHRK